jgi:hypothetical protein
MLWRKRGAQDNDVIFRRKKMRIKLTQVKTKPQTIGQDGNIESSALDLRFQQKNHYYEENFVIERATSL